MSKCKQMACVLTNSGQGIEIKCLLLRQCAVQNGYFKDHDRERNAAILFV
jgi:hypothetical protein